MPFRVKSSAPRTAAHKALLDALVAELRSPRERLQPLITEDHRTKNGIVHVQVVWDRWQECPELERWEIIQEAYRQVRGPEFTNRIRLATGLTTPEAARIGLLPFQVVPRPQVTGALAPEQYARAMIDEGASVLEDPSRPILRFETLEEGEDCQGRLEGRLPGSRWSIVQHEPGLQ